MSWITVSSLCLTQPCARKFRHLHRNQFSVRRLLLKGRSRKEKKRGGGRKRGKISINVCYGVQREMVRYKEKKKGTEEGRRGRRGEKRREGETRRVRSMSQYWLGCKAGSVILLLLLVYWMARLKLPYLARNTSIIDAMRIFILSWSGQVACCCGCYLCCA